MRVDNVLHTDWNAMDQAFRREAIEFPGGGQHSVRVEIFPGLNHWLAFLDAI